MLEKPGGGAGGLPSSWVGAERTGAWLPAATIGVGGVGVGIIPFGVGRVTESDFLFSESAYFLCRTAWARHALQA